MKHLLSLALIAGLWFLVAISPFLFWSEEVALAQACETFTQQEAAFQRLVKQRATQPTDVSKTAYQAAAQAYIDSATNCYQATISSTLTIDAGALKAPSTEGGLSAQFVTADTKWPGETFGPDNPPGTPGGRVTYSYMPAGIDLKAEWPDTTNTQINQLVDPSLNCDVEAEIDAAFAAWAAIAAIQFERVTDMTALPGNDPAAQDQVGDIRIGAHDFFNGFPSPFAHAFIPPAKPGDPNTLAGDIHFNTQSPRVWACHPSVETIDIGLVALHEIGHAIGLDHEPATQTIAVMNAGYNETLSLLQPDDLAGARAIYGEANPISIDTCANDLFSNEGDLDGWLSSDAEWQPKSDGETTFLFGDSNPGEATSAYLTSPLLTRKGDLITLRFRHKFKMDQGPSTVFDGGVVEIKSEMMDWTDVTTKSFIKNGYNRLITTLPLNDPPLAGRPAFAGDSGGYIESVINLNDFVPGDETFQFRFHLGVDAFDRDPLANNGDEEGWNIDAVKVCGEYIFYFPIIFKNG